MKVFLSVIAAIAALPGLFFLFAISDDSINVLALIWIGVIAVAWWTLTKATDKAGDAMRFAADQMERRTQAMEQSSDAETIGNVANAGKSADESETARKWTTRTDAFGRVVGEDDE